MYPPLPRTCLLELSTRTIIVVLLVCMGRVWRHVDPWYGANLVAFSLSL